MRRSPGIALAMVAVAMLAVAAPVRALVGDWTSFTKLSEVRDMEVFKGSLFAATSGGIRKVSLDGGAETVYRNTEGLVEVSIQGLVSTPRGELWASAEPGTLYRLRPDQSGWEEFGRSYKGAAWKMNKRAILYREPYLILGSEKGLSFFNTRKGVADANVTKMGAERVITVNSVAMEGDTLYAGTSKGIFRSTLHLDRLLSDVGINIFNPDIWSLVPGTESNLFHHPASPPASAAFGDTIAPTDSALLPPGAEMSRAHGALYFTDAGVASDYDGATSGPEARVSRYGGIHVGGKKFPNPYFMEGIEAKDGRIFLGSVEGLFEFHTDGGRYRLIQNKEDLPVHRITMIQANHHGVFAVGIPDIHRLDQRVWRLVPGFNMMSDMVDADRRGSFPIDILGRNEIYLGTWGYGFHAFSGGTGRTFDAKPGSSCLESADPRNPQYPVIYSQAPYRDKGIWLGSMRNAKSFSLAFYDFRLQSLVCFNVNSEDNEPRNLEVIGDSILAVITKQGVEAFRIRETGSLVALDPSNLSSLIRAPEETHDGVMDSQGTLWVTTLSGKMLFVPSIGFGDGKAHRFRVLEGFPGKECKSMARDPLGHIWTGCMSGGIVEITPGRDTLSHSFRRYGLNDGLLSEEVHHLDVDTTNGDVWAVTDKGLARFESASRPLFSNLSSARAFPNPFLSKHSHVTFDGLEAGSELRVLTQSGTVVWSRQLTSADGGQLRWDGRNRSGAKVREGIYLYSIRSPKHLKNGKIIVAR